MKALGVGLLSSIARGLSYTSRSQTDTVTVSKPSERKAGDDGPENADDTTFTVLRPFEHTVRYNTSHQLRHGTESENDSIHGDKQEMAMKTEESCSETDKQIVYKFGYPKKRVEEMVSSGNVEEEQLNKKKPTVINRNCAEGLEEGTRLCKVECSGENENTKSEDDNAQAKQISQEQYERELKNQEKHSHQQLRDRVEVLENENNMLKEQKVKITQEKDKRVMKLTESLQKKDDQLKETGKCLKKANGELNESRRLLQMKEKMMKEDAVYKRKYLEAMLKQEDFKKVEAYLIKKEEQFNHNTTAAARALNDKETSLTKREAKLCEESAQLETTKAKLRDREKELNEKIANVKNNSQSRKANRLKDAEIQTSIADESCQLKNGNSSIPYADKAIQATCQQKDAQIQASTGAASQLIDANAQIFCNEKNNQRRYKEDVGENKKQKTMICIQRIQGMALAEKNKLLAEQWNQLQEKEKQLCKLSEALRERDANLKESAICRQKYEEMKGLQNRLAAVDQREKEIRKQAEQQWKAFAELNSREQALRRMEEQVLKTSGDLNGRAFALQQLEGQLSAKFRNLQQNVENLKYREMQVSEAWKDLNRRKTELESRKKEVTSDGTQNHVKASEKNQTRDAETQAAWSDENYRQLYESEVQESQKQMRMACCLGKALADKDERLAEVSDKLEEKVKQFDEITETLRKKNLEIIETHKQTNSDEMQNYLKASGENRMREAETQAAWSDESYRQLGEIALQESHEQKRIAYCLGKALEKKDKLLVELTDKLKEKEKQLDELTETLRKKNLEIIQTYKQASDKIIIQDKQAADIEKQNKNLLRKDAEQRNLFVKLNLREAGLEKKEAKIQVMSEDLDKRVAAIASRERELEEALRSNKQVQEASKTVESLLKSDEETQVNLNDEYWSGHCGKQIDMQQCRDQNCSTVIEAARQDELDVRWNSHREDFHELLNGLPSTDIQSSQTSETEFLHTAGTASSGCSTREQAFHSMMDRLQDLEAIMRQKCAELAEASQRLQQAKAQLKEQERHESAWEQRSVVVNKMWNMMLRELKQFSLQEKQLTESGCFTKAELADRKLEMHNVMVMLIKCDLLK